MTHTHGRGPSAGLYATEISRGLGDRAKLRAYRAVLRTAPRGDGGPVLVLPGLLADDRSTVTLRRYLRGLGHRVHGWRLGRNIGPTGAAAAGMRARLAELADRYGRPVALVGWSLGGIYARDLAREDPAGVRMVITLGSPFRLARADQSRATRAYQRFAGRHADARTLPLLEDSLPALRVPTTAVYSKRDGIVAWHTCIDRAGPYRENIAVRAAHLGYGHHPGVLWAVADRLALPADGWVPFRPHPRLRGLYPPAEVWRPS